MRGLLVPKFVGDGRHTSERVLSDRHHGLVGSSHSDFVVQGLELFGFVKMNKRLRELECGNGEGDNADGFSEVNNSLAIHFRFPFIVVNLSLYGV